ncbi:MAG: tetratricopeptide repeat protein [Gemmatimonadales bacterium]
MSKLEKLRERAKGLELRDPKGAIEAWLEVLKAQEEEADPNPDLSVFNRVGDLTLKLKDPAQAADWYDKAVDKYAELGFHNNAIAMCNKVLRNAPGRQTTYLKLAKLYAAKGFMAEAKQNFVEYAERMQRIGKIQHAFTALKEFTDISPESEHLRQMLEEHLKMYGEPGRRSSAQTAGPGPAGPASKGRDELSKSGKRKTSSLVFLDLDEPSPSKRHSGAKPPAPPPRAAPPAAPRAPGSEPAAVESLLEDVTAEPDTSLEIETTSLAPEQETDEGGGASLLAGLEITSADFGQVRASTPAPPSLRDEVTDIEVPPLLELEPTVPPEAEVQEEPPPRPPPPPPRRVSVPKAPPPPPPRAAPPSPVKPKTPGALRPPGAKPVVTGPTPSPQVKPVVPKRPPGPPPPAPPAATPPKRKTVVEIPPLELEPDFETAASESAHEVDDEPLAMDEIPPVGGFFQTEDDTSVSAGRRSGYIDLGVQGIVNQGDPGGSLVFANIEETPEALGIEELEGRVADNPDDPEAHQVLGEALIEAGERERGLEELDIATSGFESAGELQQAQDLVEEILRLDPNSVRHRQKQVEFAYRAGDKAKLIDAYLELADTLLRSDLPDKAQAVYQRVAEHDPNNARAKSALAMLAPTPPAVEKKVAAKDAKMKVRDEAAAGADFVDLGAMLLEEDEPARDTRMKVQEEEPTGDEERDFHEMLARFKQGIDENIDDTDFQSHYDLGVAFKEMGLLDEAIAEFQKALRAPESKLRTSEALGMCFFEKGAHVVAESILRRGLELPAAGDQERLGVLYWLGRSLEEQGKRPDARELYGRVFAVDIRFMDVGERVKALAKAR